ncbi:MAG TPA: CPBP family intramembrane glutamic endopeptidase [Acidobacteriota bacterium]|nr:CPBP family intramembrane glutamic endopeptidase [Acidobacteriota bacterium]
MVTELGLILGPALLAASWQGGLAKLFSFGTLRGRDVLPLIGFGAGLFVASVMSGALAIGLLRACGIQLPSANPLGHLLGNRSGLEIAAAYFIAVGLAPLCEEALFRGLLQPALEKVIPRGTAIGVTAVAFGVFHLSPSRFVPTAVMALGAGAMRAKYQSVWAGIVVHATINALGVSLALLVAKLRG